jgi:hypothetical protein
LSQKPGISICRSMSFSCSSTPASSKIPPDRRELLAEAGELLLQVGGEHGPRRITERAAALRRARAPVME